MARREEQTRRRFCMCEDAFFNSASDRRGSRQRETKLCRSVIRYGGGLFSFFAGDGIMRHMGNAKRREL